MLLNQRLDFQANQLVQSHLQNRGGLSLGEMQHGCGLSGQVGTEANSLRVALHQAGLGLTDVFASAQNFNNQVDDVTGLDETLLNLLLLSFFIQERGIFPGGQLILEADIVADNGNNTHGFRTAAGHRQHVHAEGILQTGLFVQQVADILRIGALFQVDDNADALLGGLVGNIHNVRGLFGLHQLEDIV